MIIDINAFTGTWPFFPVKGDLESVRSSLGNYGIERIFISSLDAVWCRNPHIYNHKLYDDVTAFDNVWPVPIFDPTIATWQRELDYALKNPRVKLAKLLPAYSSYKLTEADPLLKSLSDAGLGVIIQTRMEDPRRQHPLAQVPDVPAKEVADVAERHPELTVVIGGPRRTDIVSVKDRLLSLPNLYADTSQAEGMNGMAEMIGLGLKDKLVFGSHAPLLIPHSAMIRAISDVDDAAARAILWGNGERILGL